MQTCGACGETKPSSEFHLSTRYGRQRWCKVCRKAYDRHYWAKNAERRRRQSKEQRRRLLEWHHELKASTPCADCGGRFHPEAMTWDHLPGSEKIAEVSLLIRAGKAIQARKEIEKCELVCANCHAVRSYNRRRGV
ncbi:MAG TPA: hypothetical protein VHD91_03445 [Gaiellaceae bacterium]|nr:hypothetical protein [Gaiellaceae bacterium]